MHAAWVLHPSCGRRPSKRGWQRPHTRGSEPLSAYPYTDRPLIPTPARLKKFADSWHLQTAPLHSRDNKRGSFQNRTWHLGALNTACSPRLKNQVRIQTRHQWFFHDDTDERTQYPELQSHLQPQRSEWRNAEWALSGREKAARCSDPSTDCWRSPGAAAESVSRTRLKSKFVRLPR